MKKDIKSYTDRYLRYTEGKDSFRAFQLTPKKLEDLIVNCPMKKLLKEPLPGKWSVAEIINHLAEGEIVIAYRIRLILGSAGTPIQAYDQVAWARNAKMVKQDPPKSLELFRILRESNVRLLKSIPKKMWTFHGVHEERGRETIAHIIKLCAGHDFNHIMQIKNILFS